MRRIAPMEPLTPAKKASNSTRASKEHGGQMNNVRTAHACESCRHLKVRCLSNDNLSIRKCQRCARLNQECIIKPRGPRKPRKRTDARVGELEKQVEALRAAFGESAALGNSPPSVVESSDSVAMSHDHGNALVPEGGAFVNLAPTSSQVDSETPVSSCGTTPIVVSRSDTSLPVKEARRTLTPSIKTGLFNKFNAELMQHLPVTVFSDGEDAAMVQERSPTLFLAAITAAAGDSDIEVHSTLHDQLAQDFATRIVIDGEKSVEIVQALLFAAAFHNPPDAFKKSKFYQYIHMAATMAIDLGLGNSGCTATPNGPEDEMERNACRRTFIACYMTCLSVARGLHRPILMQSDRAAEQCTEALEKSPYATLKDHQLIAWVKLESIMKDVTQLLGLSESGAAADISDPRTQRTIDVFQKRLERWEKELRPGVMYPTLEIVYHYSKMCLHEIALHNGYPDDFCPPFRLRAPSNISCAFPDAGTASLDSVITSLTSAHSLLDVLLQRPARSLRVFPTFLYIRMIYCVFILLKIFFICSAPGSELGKVLHPDAIKVEHYLSRLVSHMQDAISDENCRLAAKFCVVLFKFRTWFRSQVLRMHSTSGAVDEELFEPLRLLTLHGECETPRAPQQTKTRSVHENPLAQVRGTYFNATPGKDAFYGNPSHWPKSEVPDHVDGSSMPSNIGTWQHPMPWGSRLLNSDPAQPAEKSKSESGTRITEPQIGAPPVNCSTQAPLDNANNVMDDPLDLAMEFDFDSHLWDFEMVDIIFEQT